jgi:hypothetical protein
MPEIFNTPFCAGGRCICKQIADKDRIIVCLSDPKNAAGERKERDVLVREYDRLATEQATHMAFSNGQPCGGA